jgi:YD repeat-containing protein
VIGALVSELLMRMGLCMRRVPLLLSAVVGFGIVLVAISMIGLADGRAPSGGPGRHATGAPLAEASKSDGLSAARRERMAKVRRVEKARQRWLGSPAARAQRLRSRTAFRGLRAGVAGVLLERDYRPVLAGVSANPAASIVRRGRLVRYLDNHRALLRGPHGLEVANSTVPLVVKGHDGVQRPVDLQLVRSAGGFAPVRPLAEVSIGLDSAGGAAFGGLGLRVAPEGRSVTGFAVGGQDVFYGSVGRDMDAVVAPTIHGAELFAVLRSRYSPEVLRYRVALPSGARLLQNADGASVKRGSETIAHIPNPTARDAQGTVVPVRMQIKGDELVLRIAHHSQDLAYPLLVDPEVITITEKAEGWKFIRQKRFCTEEATIFGKAPGGGESLVLEAPRTSYPTPEIPLCKEEERNYQLTWAMWSHPTEFVPAAAEYDDISTIATVEPEGQRGVEWEFSMCSKGINWDYPTVPPSHYVAEPRCNETSFVEVEMFVGELGKVTPVTVSASISIGAIVLYEKWPSPSESELYGTENPGEPNREGCLLGHPVNCATGNQVVSQTDLRVGGRGLGLNLTRTYNSRAGVGMKVSEHGPWGLGWSGPYSAHMKVEKFCRICVEDASVYVNNGSSVRFVRYEHSPWEPFGALAQVKLIHEGSSFVYTLPNQSKMTFNELGELTMESDRNGNVTTLTHGTGGRLESVTDQAGRKISFAYNSEGQVESAKDPMGNTVKYTYESGDLTSVTLPGESQPRWRFAYNSEHELTGETAGTDGTTTTEYDSSHRVISQTDPMQRKRKWEYSGNPGVEWINTTITEPNGAKTYERFNEELLPLYITRPPSSTTNYTYDFNNNLIKLEAPEGFEAEYTYNSAGDRLTEKNSAGGQMKWEYNNNHDVISVTNSLHEKTTIIRDAHGNPELIMRPAPHGEIQVTKFKYDSHGDLESMTDPLGRTWAYEYDSQGDRTGETDPTGDKQAWGYNEDSQQTSAVSPRGNVKGEEASRYTTKIERDAQGRPVTITDPLGHKTRYTYDANGNIETQTDGNGNQVKYAYDADNEPVKVKEPNGTITETGYDNGGQVISQTDGNGHTTEYVRNSAEEPSEITDPLGRTIHKEYNQAGDLTRIEYPSEVEERNTYLHYDPANRLTSTYYSDEKTPHVEYEYDGNGDLISMTDGTGKTTYIYDMLGRLTSTTNGRGETIGYEYDLANEQTKITYPNKHQIIRSYDQDGRLQTVTDWLGNQTKFTYDPDSNLTASTSPTPPTIRTSTATTKQTSSTRPK